VCTILLLAATGAAAQAPPAELLTAAPESPAFTFLGVSPTRISMPGAVRELGAELLSAIGADGRVRQGFALEVAPWSLVPGLAIPLDDYQNNFLSYVLANAQLSLGTARAAGDSASTDVSAGLRLTLFDDTDPMRDEAFTAEVGQRLRGCTGGPETTEAEIAFCADTLMANAYASRTASRWNARRLSLGAAAGLRFGESVLANGEYSGVALWAAGSQPIGAFGQLIGQLSWRQTPELDDAPESDLLVYGGRLLLGAATFGVFGEIAGENHSGDVDESALVWSAGAELRIAGNLWLSAGLGTRFDALTADDRAIVLANVRWGVADRSRLAALR
jgi:hypothetical protein